MPSITICPKCGSDHCQIRPKAKYVGGAMGVLGGGLSGGASAWSGATTGALMGAGIARLAPVPPFPATLLAGAILGALAGAVAGGISGARLGEKLDHALFNQYQCLACGHTFSR